MKNTSIILLLTILFSACKQEEKCSADFTSVDVSFSNTWTMKMSVNIDSSKIAHVLIDSFYKGKTVYAGTVKDSAFCIINKLISSALKNNYSDIVGQQAPDGSVSGIRIVSTNKTVQTLLLSDHTSSILDTVITQLTIMRNYKLTKDLKSNFKFQSYDLIIPKMEEVEFVPPVVNADQVEK